MQFMGFAMNARNADEGRSFFTKAGGGNKIGMKVVDDARHACTSDPLDSEALAYRSHADGLATAKTTWIENGIVKNLPYDRYWAAEAGEEADAARSVPLHMSGGSGSIDELIASTQRGDARHPLLVHPSRRSAHDPLYRAHT